MQTPKVAEAGSLNQSGARGIIPMVNESELMIKLRHLVKMPNKAERH